MYTYVPFVPNVSVVDLLELGAVMLAGAPAGALSKNTLWSSVPKAKVTVPPTVRFTLFGVNLIDGVACTVAAATGVGSTGPVMESPPPPHAPSAAVASVAKMIRATRN